MDWSLFPTAIQIFSIWHPYLEHWLVKNTANDNEMELDF